MGSVQPQEFRGHTFFPGADSVTPFREGYFFYLVAVSYQNGPNGVGQMSTHGLVAPRDRVQYGQLVNEVLEFVRQATPGQAGSKVVSFFDIKPHGEFRAVGVKPSYDDGYEDAVPPYRPELP